MNIKIGILLVSLMFLLLFFGQPSVYAETTTAGGAQVGTMVRLKEKQHQRRSSGANDLHIRLRTKTVDINGWEVTISNFTTSSSERVGPRDVDVNAGGADIPQCNWVTFDAKVWLKTSGWICPTNTLRKRAEWTKDDQHWLSEPAHGWEWDWARPDHQNPGQYLHLFNITNDDTADYLNVTGLAFNATMNWYEDLTQIIFPSPYPNFTLAPGQSWCTNITTIGPLYGGHIYFEYNITDGSETISENWADHPVTEPPVGGVSIPVDKFGLLVPYIALASTILVATAATTIYAKRRKKKQ